MKGYINGKLVETTTEDANKIRSMFIGTKNPRHDVRNYEERIRELEGIVAALSSKLSEPDE